MPKLTEQMQQEAVRLYTQENLSYREIASLLEISEGSLINIFRKKGIQPRPSQPRKVKPNPEYNLYNDYQIPQSVFDEQNKVAQSYFRLIES